MTKCKCRKLNIYLYSTYSLPFSSFKFLDLTEGGFSGTGELNIPYKMQDTMNHNISIPAEIESKKNKQPSKHQHSETENETEERTISQMNITNQMKSIITPFLSQHITEGDITSPNLDHEYCYRHNPRIRCNKSADAKQLTEIQHQLEELPRNDQEKVSTVWSIFSGAPSQQKRLILQGLVSQCCFPQLSLISQEISRLLKIDFLEMLPNELALKILCYLDCQSLCNAAQVSTRWKQLADDDRVWRYMCEQHIDRKCPQCGWGLPLMAVKKLQESSLLVRKKRKAAELDKEENSVGSLPPPLKIERVDESECQFANKRKNSKHSTMRKKRPWKAVYSERYKVERNWRKGFYSVVKFDGHTDGVLCCAFDNQKLMMSGSYDKTIKIWNTDTGELIRTLVGHTMGVKAIVFDEQKLISGGLDSTLKVWNWRTGECISSYTGHREGVTSVDYYDKIIVSGSADKTVKVWHVDSRTCYTLRGHTDWVTCVKIHSKSGTLFSGSDDSTVRLWDLETNECVKVYGGVEDGGHTGQIQTVIPFTYKDKMNTDEENIQEGDSNENAIANDSDSDNEDQEPKEIDPLDKYNDLPTHLLTASLDNTIKLWDARTGKCIRTQFGHIEGVWSIAADTFRIVSGAHDKTIKIWDLQSGQCMHTFGNSASVSCVALGDSRIICGMNDGELKMMCFDKVEKKERRGSSGCC